jgi:hypothetical protein
VANVSKAYSRTCRSGLRSLFRNGEPRELVAPRAMLRALLQVFWLTSSSGLFHALLDAAWLTLSKRLGGALLVDRRSKDKTMVSMIVETPEQPAMALSSRCLFPGVSLSKDVPSVKLLAESYR